ncbi:Malonyl CoA-acyl carrier protein transacylase [Enhygromyxa salina]|uniref:Malonyl CoA-acyl carrier protein transacylase n=1 Tax=Enhygromyxa salina TaxID=215803 RepID=A0A0C2D205_9BACT|nr:Malonyl CoA-acyl carrier protein transacylase [Enhygromyxa salina]
MAEAYVNTSSQEEAVEWVRLQLARACEVELHAIDVNEPFSRYGLDSLKAAQFLADLNDSLGRKLPPTLVWEYPCCSALARYLAEGAKETSVAPQREGAVDTPIAIVGMSCRFPGAPDLGSYWRILRDGIDAVRETPRDRWDTRSYYNPDRFAPGRMTTRWGGFLPAVDGFEPEFFGISPRETEQIDPQQRLMLELAWEALENAGIPPLDRRGSDTGVFFGAMWSDYARQARAHIDTITSHSATGQDLSIIAARVSYTLGLQGPSLVVNTACSSALVAVHLACQSLRLGEASLALAGGVNLMLDPESTVMMSKFGAMAPDGRSKAFDARANGYVRGEGGGVVVLKPLSQAVIDGDRIYCVIRGSATNNDGMSNGLTAPNPQAQVDVLRSANARAKVHPSRVQYVETHGTGTLLGDPIEAGALGSVLGAGRGPDNSLRIGSVKTNIGHLEAAAGVAGLIKTALAMYLRRLPPSLFFEVPNPHIDFEGLGLRVQTRVEDWPEDEGQALAGVSSFGFGGTNCHVVLAGVPARSVGLVPLAADSVEGLRVGAAKLRELGKDPRLELDALCHAAGQMVGAGRERVAITVRSVAELEQGLSLALASSERAGVARSGVGAPLPGAPRLVFMFAGQGSQWLAMGRELVNHEPVVRAQLRECEVAMRPFVEWSLLEVLTTEDPELVERSEVAQPCIFAMQVALAALWRSWGIEPEAVVGQSMGEVAAAYVAGALSLPDAARVICERARIVSRVRGSGGMALIELSLAKTRRALEPYEGRLSVAVSSSPCATVVSGNVDALVELLTALEAQGISQRRIEVDYASHSAHMDPLRGALEQALAKLEPRPAKLPLYSTVTAAPIAGELLDAAYWVRNLREPVLFSSACERLLEDGLDVFLDVNPHPLLTHSVKQILAAQSRTALSLASMRRGEIARSVLCDSLGVLFARGADVCWARVSPPGEFSSATLPGPVTEPDDADPQLCVISAHSPEALTARVRSWAGWLGSRSDLSLRDLCFTAGARTSHHAHRLAFVERSSAGLATTLASIAAQPTSAGEVSERPKIVFVFPGQGSQWVGMGRELLATEPVFRASIEACGRALAAHVGWDLTTQLCCLPAASQSAEPLPEANASRLSELDVVQPVLWAIEVALAALWRSWGIEPDAVVGHSMGEVAAAHVAGALSLEDAARVIALRSKLVRERASGHGGMALVELSLAQAEQAIVGREAQLAVAVSNGPRASVLSGEVEALEAVLAQLRERDVFCRRINVDYASHSPQMDALRADLITALEGLQPQACAVPMLSTVTGEWLREVPVDAQYWARNLREPVRFADAVRGLALAGHDVFVEISPHLLLRPAIEDGLRELGRQGIALGSMRRDESAREQLLTSLGALYSRGVTPNFAGVFNASARLVSLPTYPWQRERHWVAVEPEPEPEPALEREPATASGHPLLGPSRNSPAAPELWTWERRVGVDAPRYLGDHRVGGACVLPAAAYVEMAFAAAAERWPGRATSLVELALHEALVFEGDQPRRVQLVLNEDHLTFFSRSEAGEWRSHASARVDLGEPTVPHVAVDLASLRRGSVHELARHHAGLAAVGIVYGPRFRGLKQIWRGGDEAAGELLEVQRDGALALADPPTLDACMQVAYALLDDAGADPRPFVPARIGRVRWVGGAGSSEARAPRWVRATTHAEDRSRDTLRVDLEVFDAAGHLLIELTELVFQRAGALAGASAPAVAPELTQPGPELAPGPQLWTSTWHLASAAPVTSEPAAGGWIVIASRRNSAAIELAQALVERGETVTLIGPNALRTDLGEDAAIELIAAPSSMADEGAHADCLRPLLRPLLRGGAAAPSVLLFAGGDSAGAGEPSQAIAGCADALAWIRATAAITGERAGGAAPRLWLITRGAREVIPGEALALDQTPIWGLGQALIYEHPELHCTMLDSTDAAVHAIHAIADEVQRATAEQHVALRGTSRYVGRLERHAPPTAPTSRVQLSAESSYLITGGLGGLGLALARWLVARGARHLALMSRGGVATAAQREAIAALEAASVQVLVVRADVSRRAEVEAALAQINGRLPPLRGVVHAAGVLEDGLISTLPAEQLARVMAPKVLGAAHLDALTQDVPLELFVLFSSAASLIGTPGQANYAAGNAFLDGLARARRARGLAGLAINWGPFAGVGLAAEHDNRGSRLDARGMGSLEVEAGYALLDALLDPRASAQIGVLTLDVSRWLSAYPALANAPLFELVRPAAERAGEARGASVGTGAGWSRAQLEGLVREQAITVLRVQPARIKRTTDLMSLGVDSLLGLELRNSLEAKLGIRLSASIFWEHPRIDDLAIHLQGLLGDHEAPAPTPAPPVSVVVTPAPPAQPRVETPAAASSTSAVASVRPKPPPTQAPAPARIDRGHTPTLEPIAIIGVDGRYPQADNVDQLWAHLSAGHSCIERVPGSRWATDEQANDGCWGGFLSGVEDFDPGLFNLSPREALSMDPAERLILETAWRALEDAGRGQAGERGGAGERAVGVFVGAMYGQYAWLADEDLRGGTLFNNSYFALANRVSHFFDFRGPSVAIDTACSSSTLAIHLACQSLRAGDCAMALAGGVNLSLHPNKYEGLRAYGMLASGRVNRALGQGDGFIPGEGVGMVLLKPLAAALRDGDRIDALIRSSAANHNGRGMGYTAPSPQVQAELIERALALAQLDPGDLSYIELAANGSPLADEGELSALAKVFRRAKRAGPIPIGTIKNNIGHLEAASGISQLTKVLMQLRHGQLAPAINTEPRNPHLQLEAGPLRVQTQAEAWGPTPSGPRRVLINSFGGGGAGACLVVEEHREPARASASVTRDQPLLFVFSAPDAARLDSLIASFEQWVATAPFELRDLAHTLLSGRASCGVRLAFVASTISELRERLASARQGDDAELFRGELIPGQRALALFEDDEDLRETVTKWLKKGRLDRLAQLWVAGIELDWRLLPASLRGRPVRAPGVPFERQRLWPDTGARVIPAPVRKPIAATRPEAATPDSRPQVTTLERVCGAIAELLQLPNAGAVHPDQQLRRYGFDSLAAARLVNRLRPNDDDPDTRRRLLALQTARAWAQTLDSIEAQPNPDTPDDLPPNDLPPNDPGAETHAKLEALLLEVAAGRQSPTDAAREAAALNPTPTEVS